MKKALLILMMLSCFFIEVKAQQVVTSGGFSEKNDLSVEWVLGGKLFGTNIFVVNDPPVVKSSLIQDSIPEFSIKVYPTYTRDYVTVEISSKPNPVYFIDLYNNIGEKIIERVIAKQSSIQVKMSNLTSGIYFLKIVTVAPEQLIHTEKIIKL